MRTLTLNELAAYLPYSLQLILKKDWHKEDWDNYRIVTLDQISQPYSTDWFYIGGYVTNEKNCHVNYEERQFKPLLRPLSDCADINSKAMNDMNCDLLDQIIISDFANKEMSFYSLPYGVAQLLFAAHVDCFSLIPDGLAIDLNTLK